MTRHQIVGVQKPHRQSPHEHITHVKYDGLVWTREHVIRLIEARTDSFYVSVGFNHSEVGVVHPEYPRPAYLRTYADGKWNDNLLALPPC